jgi:hypothetical protein
VQIELQPAHLRTILLALDDAIQYRMGDATDLDDPGLDDFDRVAVVNQRAAYQQLLPYWTPVECAP